MNSAVRIGEGWYTLHPSRSGGRIGEAVGSDLLKCHAGRVINEVVGPEQASELGHGWQGRTTKFAQCEDCVKSDCQSLIVQRRREERDGYLGFLTDACECGCRLRCEVCIRVMQESCDRKSGKFGLGPHFFECDQHTSFFSCTPTTAEDICERWSRWRPYFDKAPNSVTSARRCLVCCNQEDFGDYRNRIRAQDVDATDRKSATIAVSFLAKPLSKVIGEFAARKLDGVCRGARFPGCVVKLQPTYELGEGFRSDIAYGISGLLLRWTFWARAVGEVWYERVDVGRKCRDFGPVHSQPGLERAALIPRLSVVGMEYQQSCDQDAHDTCRAGNFEPAGTA